MSNNFNKLRQFYQAQEDSTSDIQKISPAAAGLAGWWLGGTIRDDYARASQPTPAQRREFERQVEQSLKNKGKRVNKESAMEKMQSFFKKDTNSTYVRKTPTENKIQPINDLLKEPLSLPPFAGARLDPTSRRWVRPENIGQTIAARGGKKRFRAVGTGGAQRSVSGHAAGGAVRAVGAGRKAKTREDIVRVK